MPVLYPNNYRPKGWYRNGHFNTIVSNSLLRSPQLTYQRERIQTPDADFLDLDYIRIGSDKVVLLCHGLEGSSQSSYIRVFSQFYKLQGWDIVGMNYRGCSGEDNLNVRSYNSGLTDDLHLVVQLLARQYEQIVLIGFSLGGNLTLKYLGEGVHPISQKLTHGIAISVPVHLSDASKTLLKKENFIYQTRFLRSLKAKIKRKAQQFPNAITVYSDSVINTLYNFDEYYTAPLFGYQSAEHYYACNQSIQWLHSLLRPSLIVNAIDDPFLGKLCYPDEVAEKSEILSLCLPRHGGHVGFTENSRSRNWICQYTLDYINANI